MENWKNLQTKLGGLGVYALVRRWMSTLDYQKMVFNLDDITHIDFLHRHVGIPDVISFRYNPGPMRTGSVYIGLPEQAKFGLTRPQLFQAFERVRRLGAKRFGLHTMVASNVLDPQFVIDTATMLFRLAIELHKELDLRVEFVNLGGGMGIPHRPEETPLNVGLLGRRVQAAYDRWIAPTVLHPLAVFMENGRYITGPHGYLITEVIHRKEIYRSYVGVDANMANLMRPALYGAYHHISVLGKEDEPPNQVVDVVGSLCENNDKFAIDRGLPPIEIGDILVIHDTGAHGQAMGFQYNGKLRSAEFLLHADNSIQQIRRAETPDDYFSTLNF